MFQVLAPLVVVRGPDGHTHHRYAGELVEYADPATAEYHVAQGMVARLGGSSLDAQPKTGAPAFVAPKAQWVDYAVSQGFDRTEAEALPKAKLIEALQ